MTLYVHSIPKSTCTSRDIVNIFTSVAQIKQVEMNQEKGRARVELYDKASISFVLSKKWRINGSELYVTNSEQSFEDKRHKKPFDEKEVQTATTLNARMNTEMPYQLYKENANSFWADIPHHKTRIKPKKSKMKFRVTKRTLIEYKMDGCKNKRKIQKWKKKSSKVIQKMGKDHYSSLNLDEFNSHVNAVIKEISGSNITDQNLDLVPVNKSHAGEEKHTEKEFSSMNTSIPHIKCNEELETPIDSHEIPVCIMFNQKLNVIWCDSYSTSLIELKEKIKAEVRIPTDLQLLLHKGKVLNPKLPLKFTQYETIHVLIKGKGGMQSSEIGKKLLELHFLFNFVKYSIQDF